MKKIISILMIITILFSLSACNKSEEESEKETYKVLYVSDTRGESSPENKNVREGIEQSFENYTLELLTKQPITSDTYEDVITSALATDQFNLAVSNNVGINDKLIANADKYKNLSIGIVGSVDQTGTAMSVTFKDEESAFLAGVLAAKKTKTNKVGFIGGYEKLNEAYETGFIAGVKAVNKKAKVYTEYISSYNNTKKGKEAAQKQIAAGADVIFSVCGSSSIGINQAVKNAENVYVINSDLYTNSPDEITLGAVNKNYKNATIYLCDAYIMGYFETREFRLGIQDLALDINMSDANAGEQIKEEVKKYKSIMSVQDMKIPRTKAELAKYDFNKLLKKKK